MTEQEARVWLERCRKLRKELNRLSEQIAEERTKAEKMTQSLSGMPMGSGYSDKVGFAAERLATLENARTAKIKEFVAAQRETERRIVEAKLCSDETEALIYFYAKCMSGREVALTMNTSDRNIRRYLKSGIEKFSTKTCPIIVLRQVL